MWVSTYDLHANNPGKRKLKRLSSQKSLCGFEVAVKHLEIEYEGMAPFPHIRKRGLYLITSRTDFQSSPQGGLDHQYTRAFGLM